MSPLPQEAISGPTTRVMVALLRVYERDGRATVRSVAEEAGRSLGVTFHHLNLLWAKGLVDFGLPGTLRPLVKADWRSRHTSVGHDDGD